MNNLENNLGNAELSEDELDMVSGGATYLKTGLVAFEETVSVGKEGSLNAFEETVKEEERYTREREKRMEIKKLERFGGANELANQVWP